MLHDLRLISENMKMEVHNEKFIRTFVEGNNGKIKYQKCSYGKVYFTLLLPNKQNKNFTKQKKTQKTKKKQNSLIPSLPFPPTPTPPPQKEKNPTSTQTNKYK